MDDLENLKHVSKEDLAEYFHTLFENEKLGVSEEWEDFTVDEKVEIYVNSLWDML